MKKTIVKLLVCCLVFLLTVTFVNKFMNRGHDNMTMEMAPASFPLVTMVMRGTPITSSMAMGVLWTWLSRGTW